MTMPDYGTVEFAEALANNEVTPTEDVICIHVLTALWQQGKRASVNDTCKYRTNNNLRCAVGWCIPDEIYEPGMEGRSISALLYNEKYKTVLPSYFAKYERLISSLQALHDRSDTWRSREILRARIEGFSVAILGYSIYLKHIED